MSYYFLRRAEQYCEQSGDELWFKEVYTRHRENYSVTDATWRTLAFLYGDAVADNIEDEDMEEF